MALFTAWSIVQEKGIFEAWSSISDCKKRRSLVIRKFKDDYKLVSQCKIVGAIKRPAYPVAEMNKDVAPRIGDWWCITLRSGFGTCYDSQAGCADATKALRDAGHDGCGWTTSVWGFTYRSGKDWKHRTTPTAETCAFMRDRAFDSGGRDISACTSFTVKE